MLIAMPSLINSTSLGKSVAAFSGANVHKRLVSEEEYKTEQWETAFKKAFLGTDEDIRAGESSWSVVHLWMSLMVL